MPELLQPSTPLGASVPPRGVLASRPKLCAAHGEHDRTSPVALGQKSAALARKAGLAVEYLEHEGGHELPPAIVEFVRTSLAAQLAARRTTNSTD